MTNFLYRNYNKILVFILIVFFGFLFFYKIQAPSIFEEDEAKMAEISREILVTHKWIDIQHNFKPNFHKPPLYNWLTVASFKTFGVNEFSVRLWAAIFGLGTIILTFLMGLKLFDRKTALLSAIILGTNILFLNLSRVGLVDTGLTFFTTLTIFCFLKSFQEQKKVFLALTGLSFAFGFLTKGPLGLILPGATIIGYLLVKKDLKFIYRNYLEILIGAVIFCLIGLPWWIIEYLLHGSAFIHGLFGQFMFGIFTHGFQKHGEPIYFYFPVLLLGMLPWSIFAYYGLFIAFTKKHFKNLSLFLIWFLVVFGLFSLAVTKIPSYILPLLPALALITGYSLKNLLENSKNPALKIILFGLFSAFLFLIFLLLFFIKIDPFWAQLGIILKNTFLSCFLISLIALGFSLIKNQKIRIIGSIISLCLISLVFWYSTIKFIVPFLEKIKPPKEAAKIISQKLNTQNYQLYTYEDWRVSSYLFYFQNQNSLEQIKDLPTLLKLQHRPNKIIFINTDVYKKIKPLLVNNSFLGAKGELTVIR